MNERLNQANKKATINNISVEKKEKSKEYKDVVKKSSDNERKDIINKVNNTKEEQDKISEIKRYIDKKSGKVGISKMYRVRLFKENKKVI